jgi:hypothetical protein
MNPIMLNKNTARQIENNNLSALFNWRKRENGTKKWMVQGR